MTGLQLFDLICYLLGFIMFVLTAVGVATARVNLLALGLAAWILVPLVHTILAIGN